MIGDAVRTIATMHVFTDIDYYSLLFSRLVNEYIKAKFARSSVDVCHGPQIAAGSIYYLNDDHLG
jgi:hypothetical protein